MTIPPLTHKEVIAIPDDDDDNDDSCGPIPIPIAASILTQTKDVLTYDKVHTIPSDNLDDTNASQDEPSATMDDPHVTMDNDNENRVIDLWDDNVEPEINRVAKILNRDLFLTNDVNEINNLLESLIEIQSSDFLSYGGPTVIIIIMNKFKKNEFVLRKCCKLVWNLLFRNQCKQLLARISEDGRFMRCLVQCMNQFPKNDNLQFGCFLLLSWITSNNRVDTDLFIGAFKRNDFNDSLSGLQSLISGMKEFPSDMLIQNPGCSILCRVSAFKEHKMVIREHGAISVLESALETYKYDNAAIAIQNLTEKVHTIPCLNLDDLNVIHDDPNINKDDRNNTLDKK